MRFLLTRALCLFFVSSIWVPVCGQRVNQYHLEAGAMASSDQTPFWLRANQYGTVPLQAPALRLNAGIYSGYRKIDSTRVRRFADWGYGFNVIGNGGATSQLLLPEAYVKGRLGAFELYAGRRREVVGLVDTLLTTGAYAWSGNALPIPKVQIGLPNFTSIPFTKGVLSVMGAFSHGWFESSDRLIKGSYLHQKYVYGRLGKTTWPFRIYAGFNHNVIWAGSAAPGTLNPNVSVNGQLPSTFQYYPAVILGTRGTQRDQIVTSFEDNRIGNHLGSIDFAADVTIGSWNAYVYRQFVYDDGSLFYGTNLDDGLNGLRLKNLKKPTGGAFYLRQITLEYLFTGSQGGDLFVIDDNKRRGRDNYFNHSQFVDGWVYFGRTIGTPFLTPQTEVSSAFPDYGVGIANNRVSAYHLGISTLLFNKIDISTRLSTSRNAGTYNNPYASVPRQFSGLFTVSVPLNWLGGVVLNGSVALDSGELLPNSVGGYLGIRKTGLLGSKAAAPVSASR
jgi:hypothetical protein